MSLRLKLALAIATIAGLVAGVTGLVVYDREKADRLDRARRSVAQTVRIYAEVLSDPNLARTPPAGAIVEPADSENPQIPPDLRLQLTANPEDAKAPPDKHPDSHVYSEIASASGIPIVIAGTRLPNGDRVYASRSFLADANALADLRVALVQVCIGGALLGAMLGFAVSLQLGRRLRRQVTLARRLAAGDLDARLNPRGGDEIAQLGRALDEMAEALSRKLGELDEAAEREKRFSSDVAHELRTPVTGLVAAAALLDDSRAAGMVRERASALAALVEDLLEVMRLESGELPRLDPFDLARLVRDVVHLRLPGADVDAPHELAVLNDSRRVERIVANLLDNARRHGRPPVQVRVLADGGDALIVVRDHGDGFGGFLPHAGERFALARPERGGGTGLGLAICRGQARIIGATLDLRDDGGAVALLRMPSAVTARPTPVQTALELA
jgi:signal transduction histidine kinase